VEAARQPDEDESVFHPSRRELTAVALPAEHGGWSFLAEPAILGLAVAPSAAGACLALAALAAFLARQPLKLVLTDRRRGARYPRTALARRVFVACAGLAFLLVATAVFFASTPLWPPLVAAAPIGLLAVAFDALGRSREALAETAGAVAFGASATAIALAGGAALGGAWGVWALLALRAVTSVLYVRARLRLDRGRQAGARAVHVAHAAALAVACGLAAAGIAPWLAPALFFVLLARAGWGLSPARGRVRPQALGWQEVGYGAVTVALLAVGYRAGW
jgi:YwiC-like protein